MGRRKKNNKNVNLTEDLQKDVVETVEKKEVETDVKEAETEEKEVTFEEETTSEEEVTIEEEEVTIEEEEVTASEESVTAEDIVEESTSENVTSDKENDETEEEDAETEEEDAETEKYASVEDDSVSEVEISESDEDVSEEDESISAEEEDAETESEEVETESEEVETESEDEESQCEENDGVSTIDVIESDSEVEGTDEEVSETAEAEDDTQKENIEGYSNYDEESDIEENSEDKNDNSKSCSEQETDCEDLNENSNRNSFKSFLHTIVSNPLTTLTKEERDKFSETGSGELYKWLTKQISKRYLAFLIIYIVYIIIGVNIACGESNRTAVSVWVLLAFFFALVIAQLINCFRCLRLSGDPALTYIIENNIDFRKCEKDFILANHIDKYMRWGKEFIFFKMGEGLYVLKLEEVTGYTLVHRTKSKCKVSIEAGDTSYTISVRGSSSINYLITALRSLDKE